MSAKLMPAVGLRFVDANTGEALAGGKVYFYLAGTSAPKAVYADGDGVSALTNPVILDSNGEAQIWLGTGYYRVAVTDLNDVPQPQYDADDVSAYAENVSGIVAIANGGTGAATKAAGFDALSPLTTAGDILYGGAAGTGTRLAKGTANQVLHSGSVPSFSAVDLAADVTGTLPVANGGTGETSLGAAAADGAITTKHGSVAITKGSAAALTLAAPIVGTDDFKVLRIVATTAFVHTVTNAAPGFNAGGAGKDVATFGGAIGDSMEVMAYQGVWLVLNLTNVVLA